MLLKKINLNHINNAKDILEQVPKELFLKKNSCCFRYLCCQPKHSNKIKYKEFMAEKIKRQKHDEFTEVQMDRCNQTDDILEENRAEL